MGQRNHLQAALHTKHIEDTLERWGGNRTHHGINRNAHRRNKGAAQLPVAVVGRQQNSAPLGFADGFQMAQPLNADAVTNAFRRKLFEADKISKIFAESLKGLARIAVENLLRGHNILVLEDNANVFADTSAAASVEEEHQVTDAQTKPIGDFARKPPHQKGHHAVEAVDHSASSGGMEDSRAMAISLAALGLPSKRALSRIRSSRLGLTSSESTTAGRSRSRSR